MQALGELASIFDADFRPSAAFIGVRGSVGSPRYRTEPRAGQPL